MAGIGGHQRGYEGRTDVWLTPRWIIESLGPFDLDPCSPPDRPWPTATIHYTQEDDGLSQPWSGRVWLNPPYGPKTALWLRKISEHGNGISLIFARTETEMFHRFGWDAAHSMLFLEGRLHFCDIRGNPSKFNAGGPSVLIAYGESNSEILEMSGTKGKFLRLK